MGQSRSSSNINIGKIIEDPVQLNRGENYLIYGDECFPKFYYDYGNHAGQLDEWFNKIKFSITNKSYPFSPAMIIDPPKTGKSAFLRRFLPHRVLTSFPKAKIIHMDFLNMPMGNDLGDPAVAPVQFEYFGRILFSKLSDCLGEIGFKIGAIGNVQIEVAIVSVFEQLNKWLIKKGSICFMLWDEVQRWFSIPSSNAAGLFNTVTLHKAFTNIAFVITGSGMAQVFKAVLSFPSNGTYWASAAHHISLYPRNVDESRVYHDQQSNTTIASVQLDNEIVENMVKTLRIHHQDSVCPENILEFIPESTPADIAYFCALHSGGNTGERLMRQTMGKCMEKLVQDFRVDLFPVLKAIATKDSKLFQMLVRIASATLTTDKLDLAILGQWAPLVTALLRVDSRNLVAGDNPRICFAGRYGYLIVRCTDFNNTTQQWQPTKINQFNKLPIPAAWASVALLHSTLEKAPLEKREATNAKSVEVFTRWNMLIGDWVNNKSYGYFYRVGGKHPTPEPIVEPEGKTKYLEYLRLIRNTISHIQSRDKISEISEHMPACIYEWIGHLLMFLPN